MRPSFDDDPQSHPHTRGANWSVAVTQSASTESSPHTWGKSRVPSTCALRIGVIPTHVGQMKMGRTPGLELQSHPHTRGANENGAHPWTGTRASHPHTRGANKLARALAAYKGESSPHTWGKCRWLHQLGLRRRVIPTHVGQILLYRRKWWSTVQFSFNFNEDNPSSRPSHLPQTRNLQPQFK